MLGLYGSVAFSVLVSLPLQLITFIMWSKRPYRSSTVFRQLGRKRFLILVAISAIAWLVCYILLQALDSSYIILDNTSSLLGIIAAFLTMFSFVEYTTISLIQVILAAILYAIMLPSEPDILVHLIFGIYTIVCVGHAYVHVRKLYKEQQQA